MSLAEDLRSSPSNPTRCPQLLQGSQHLWPPPPPELRCTYPHTYLKNNNITALRQQQQKRSSIPPPAPSKSLCGIRTVRLACSLEVMIGENFPQTQEQLLWRFTPHLPSMYVSQTLDFSFVLLIQFTCAS